jgi:hypothetical protein
LRGASAGSRRDSVSDPSFTAGTGSADAFCDAAPRAPRARAGAPAADGAGDAGHIVQIANTSAAAIPPPTITLP